MSNKSELEGNWGEQKRKLKEKFTFLTDADLAYKADKKEAMMEKLQATLGKSKTELVKIIEAL